MKNVFFILFYQDGFQESSKETKPSPFLEQGSPDGFLFSFLQTQSFFLHGSSWRFQQPGELHVGIRSRIRACRVSGHLRVHHLTLASFLLLQLERVRRAFLQLCPRLFVLFKNIKHNFALEIIPLSPLKAKTFIVCLLVGDFCFFN